MAWFIRYNQLLLGTDEAQHKFRLGKTN